MRKESEQDKSGRLLLTWNDVFKRWRVLYCTDLIGGDIKRDMTIGTMGLKERKE